MPDFVQRRNKLRKLLASQSIPALLLTNFTNVTYLTGFTGDDSYLVVHPKGEILISDQRYSQQIEEECPELETAIRGPAVKQLEITAQALASAKLSSVGFEAASMTFAAHAMLEKSLKNCSLKPTSGLVEELRQIKDKEEIVEIRRAIRIAEQAFAVIRASLRLDQTEKQVADELEHQIRLFGGTCGSFPSIIGAGPRAALPHGRPKSDVYLGDSDFVLIDWGARGRLYISDLTRVLVTGKISPKLQRVYGVVLQAQKAAIEAIKPGALLSDVDAAARNVIAKAGFGAAFGHGLGHGIGLQVHEAPRLGANQTETLKTGMVITVEPGIYLPGWGGVRIEDDCLVTKTGCEVLSKVPKELADCMIA